MARGLGHHNHEWRSGTLVPVGDLQQTVSGGRASEGRLRRRSDVYHPGGGGRRRGRQPERDRRIHPQGGYEEAERHGHRHYVHSGRLARLQLCHRRDDHAWRPLPRAGDGCRRVAAVLRHQGRRRDPAGRLCVGYGHRHPELLLYGAGGGPGRRRHQLRRRQHRVERCDDPRRRDA